MKPKPVIVVVARNSSKFKLAPVRATVGTSCIYFAMKDLESQTSSIVRIHICDRGYDSLRMNISQVVYEATENDIMAIQIDNDVGQRNECEFDAKFLNEED